MEETTQWNYDEFKAYILLYAASTDLELTEKEESLILKTISKSSYDKVKTVYDQSNDYEHIQTILSYKGLYFPTAARAQELIDLIIDMFKTDGDFSTLEKNCLLLLKRLV